MKGLLRFFGFLFAAGTILFVVGVAGVAGVMWHFSQDLPDYSQLKDYEPPVMTRVHAADGSLLAEYAKERRLYIPIQAVPNLVKHAFMAAEDKDFYKHGGLDFPGIARAALYYVENYGSGRHPQGASTITQQVAKNFLLTNKVTFSRKIREALLALKIERAYSKDKILELYLNEIYLGMGAYGVAAAALTYFDKGVNELTVAQAAYLAALPKGPNNYQPFRHPKRALDRRNWVIDQMAEDGFIKKAAAEEAKKEPLGVVSKSVGPHYFSAEYFAEEVRRELYDRYGEKKLYEGGLSVRTTLDPKLQVMARNTLVQGLVDYDEHHAGWRGPIKNIDIKSGDWGVALSKVNSLDDIAPWRLAVVLNVDAKTARLGLKPGRLPSGALSKARDIAIVPLAGMKWVKVKHRTVRSVEDVLKPGDVVYVEPAKDAVEYQEEIKKKKIDADQYVLRQVPKVSGAMVVEDPWTGRVLAMAGGFSYDESQFNRATQALRQPGSSFKPIVYAAALDNGYTPSSLILDAPIEIDQGPGLGVWKPSNYEHDYFGPSTLRFGLEHSRNVMTVRLAQDIGMPLIAEYAKRFGVYDNLPPYLSFALGAGETTLLRMVTAYAMIDNGGRKVTPTLIDRIQDRYGHTVYKHDKRECIGCDAKNWHDQPEPVLIDRREQVLDPMTAYQITSLMEGVVRYGTGTALSHLGRPVAGKTGTTSDYKDAWFIGFTPNLVVGVYIGYDNPKSLGRGETGGRVAAPVVRDFMKDALKGKPAVPFRVPPGIKLVRVDPRTGVRVGPEAKKAILEAFKPGTAPPDSFNVAGYGQFEKGGEGAPQPMIYRGGVSPDADRAVRTGGGLY
ncbi:MAG TPA: penicillin-binding protein 1A [Pseudolabrys sp.]|nr:penicillin-binding protein 1A [Pseudolabrys sp.]